MGVVLWKGHVPQGYDLIIQRLVRGEITVKNQKKLSRPYNRFSHFYEIVEYCSITFHSISLVN